MSKMIRSNSFRLHFFIGLIVLLGIIWPVMAGNTIIITNNTPDGIQGAINHGYTKIILEPGIYRQNGITFSNDTIIEADPSPLVNGNSLNTIIDGLNKNSIFISENGAPSLTIDNLTLQNGHAPEGEPGGIGTDGGAIYAHGPVTVISSIITNCSAGNGGQGKDGTIGGDGGSGGNGGAIYTDSLATIISSTIVQCSSGNGGSGGTGSTQVHSFFGNTTMPGNRGSRGSGGAVYAGGRVSLVSSSITHCSGRFGGALFSKSSLILSVSRVNGCSAEIDGGALYSEGPSSITLSSLITNCTAGRRGGTIYSGSSVMVISSDILNCTAGEDGGASFSLDSIIVNSSVISNCSSETGFGGAFVSFGSVRVVSSSISNCSAITNNGGAIYVLGRGTVTLNSTLITNCFAGISGGGAIFLESTEGLTVSNTTITDCSSDDFGGAIYLENSGDGLQTSTIVSSTISNCTAAYYGGAIYAENGKGSQTIRVVSSAITNCSAGHAGSALYTNNHGQGTQKTIIISSSLEDCHTGWMGCSAVYTNASILQFCDILNENSYRCNEDFNNPVIYTLNPPGEITPVPSTQSINIPISSTTINQTQVSATAPMSIYVDIASIGIVFTLSRLHRKK
jgi:hypothetical protein